MISNFIILSAVSNTLIWYHWDIIEDYIGKLKHILDSSSDAVPKGI